MLSFLTFLLPPYPWSLSFSAISSLNLSILLLYASTASYQTLSSKCVHTSKSDFLFSSSKLNYPHPQIHMNKCCSPDDITNTSPTLCSECPLSITSDEYTTDFKWWLCHSNYWSSSNPERIQLTEHRRKKKKKKNLFWLVFIIAVISF